MNPLPVLVRAALALAVASLATACGNDATSAADPTPLAFKVGRTRVEWIDPTRDERCGEQPAGTKRRLQADLWYPADPAPGTAPEPLLDAAQVEFLSATQDVPPEVLRRLPSDSRRDAAVSARSASYPVLLMSHGGGGGSPLQLASTAEALAAKGYVVVGLSHPYHSAATFFADGDIAVFDPACDPLGAMPPIGDDPTYEDFTANWRYTVDLDAYLAADLASAVSQLKTLNVGAGRFAGRLQLDRIGAFGHSFGGSHAFRALRTFPEVVAAADLDGTLFSDDSAVGAGPGKAWLAMLGADGSADGDAATAALIVGELRARGLTAAQAEEVAARGSPSRAFAASSPAYRVTVPAARHQNFTDVGLWAAYGVPVDPTDVNVQVARAVLDLQHAVLASFFDVHLRRRVASITLPATPLGDVRLEVR